MPLRRSPRQYEQLSQFEKGRIIGMMEAGASVTRVASQLGRYHCVVRRCWDQWIREIARDNWTAAEWNQIVFRDESRFNLSSDDNRVRVWRPRGECLNPAFASQRHTAPTAGVKIMFDPSSFANPTPLAHADTSRYVLPKGGTSQLDQQKHLNQVQEPVRF
ncbi:transposable element Tcb2 transposase [Trichonephila clavipes]|nr:transposable element Tcb2 transposase [Trichonephila clavipes]